MDQPLSTERASRWLLPVLAFVAIGAAVAALWAARSARMLGSTPAMAPFEIVELGGDDSTLAFRGYAVNPSKPAPTFELKSSAGVPWRLADARGKVVAVFFGYTHCPDVCPQTLNLLAQTMTELGGAANNVEVAFVSVDPKRDTPEVLTSYLAGFNPRFVGLTGTDDELQQTASAYGVMFKRDAPAVAVTAADSLADGHTAVGGGPSVGGREDSEAVARDDASAGTSSEDVPHVDHPADTAGGTSHADGMNDDTSIKFEPGSAAYTLTHSGTVLLIDRLGRLRSALLLPFTPADAAHDLRLLLDEGQEE